MYLINNPLKSIKIGILLLIFFLTFNVSANDEDDFLSVTKSAEQGDASAQFKLGTFYHDGTGVAEDHKQAAQWYLKAAEQDFVDAQYYIAIFYDFGMGLKEDDKQAVEWYLKAAEQGHEEAQFIMGARYYMGKGVSF